MAEVNVTWETSPEAAAEGSSRSTGRNHVFFYEKQVRNDFKSQQAQRPIFEPRIYKKVLVPGDSRLVIDTYARPKDFEDFPVEYARFMQKKDNAPAGTPLSAWGVLSDSQKAEFAALNIFTVEQFANLADEAANRIMGFHEMRKKARAFLLAQEAGDKLVKMEEESRVAAAREAEQARIISELNARIAALETRPVVVEKKQKYVMSEEHKAKMKAARAAARERKVKVT